MRRSLALHLYRCIYPICLSIIITKHFQVQFVSDGDPSYVLAGMAQVMAPKGKISYGTECVSPHQLHPEAHYPGPDGEPKSFVDPVHHWLLCEILNVIGSHTIL